MKDQKEDYKVWLNVTRVERLRDRSVLRGKLEIALLAVFCSLQVAGVWVATATNALFIFPLLLGFVGIAALRSHALNLLYRNRQLSALYCKFAGKKSVQVNVVRRVGDDGEVLCINGLDVSLCTSSLVEYRCFSSEYCCVGSIDDVIRVQDAVYSLECGEQTVTGFTESTLKKELLGLGKKELVELLDKYKDSETMHSFESLYLPELVKLSKSGRDSEEVKAAISGIETSFKEFCKEEEEAERAEYDSEATAILNKLKLSGLYREETEFERRD